MEGADQPLFGETRRRDKIINIVVATVTAIFVLITVAMAVLSSVLEGKKKCIRVYGREQKFCVYFADILLSAIIILLLIPQIFVAYWYRRGELEPKFRTMIYYNAVVTILLCIAANMYFLEVGINGPSTLPTDGPTTAL